MMKIKSKTRKKENAFKQAAGLGVVAGMRASVAPSVASHYLSRHKNKALSRSKLSFIQSPVTSALTKLLNAAELAGDKMPGTPNRIKTSQALARLASGALVGAVIYRSHRQSLLKGIFVGGASALASTYATFYLRQYLDKVPFIKDPVMGAIEDLIAVSSGVSVMKK
ncbi:DUF4126 family protein [Nafulsella turpanensis]|uniref:DUF4126 family protein n=1 Tax=Nafulsella turpanensis TaxID=1265690 RepID=UPI00034A11A6|nr:DUF4126 family protein [Nafulsella turpanensis]